MKVLRKAGEPILVPSADFPGRVYKLHVPNAFERTQLRVKTLSLGARSAGPLELARLMKEAIGSIGLQPESEAALVERVDAQVARITAFWELGTTLTVGVTPEQTEAFVRAHEEMQRGEVDLAEIAGVLTRADTPACRRFAASYAAEQVFVALWGLASWQLLADGWDNGPFAFPARPAGTDLLQSAVDALSDRDFERVGWAVRAAIQPSEDTAKNSVSPSSGPSGPDSSTAASAPPPTTP
ncbi:hypothetical protein [Azospirillum picis]|uniref:Uncharacterized protein n=1 Tax=Azospirillum picis TaxID=488438 RepID=A0ABU0MVC4_9PROT|nr:hypothetical protein [Azospirillum picis]MBP2303326.1 hypothetical protein [Azospirillum picis]MDQ0537134.1 hypothetical protein [Azospirillum picis]